MLKVDTTARMLAKCRRSWYVGHMKAKATFRIPDAMPQTTANG